MVFFMQRHFTNLISHLTVGKTLSIPIFNCCSMLAVKYGVKAFGFTSTTSTFGKVIVLPSKDSSSYSVWVDEYNYKKPALKDIYGATKVAGQNHVSTGSLLM